VQKIHNALVNWNTLQIVERLDNEGRLELSSEEQVYSVLRLKKEYEKEHEKGITRGNGGSSSANDGNDEIAAILIFQHLPGRC
jgi:hypothetical protein